MSLRTHRKSRGLSQQQCALELGFRSKGYISGLETGALKAPLRVALEIERWSKGEVAAAELVADDDLKILQTLRANPEAAGAAA